MKKNGSLKLIVLLCLIPVTGFLHAQRVTIILPEDIPPWVIHTERRGIAVDMIREIFQYHRYRVDFVFTPLRRLQETFDTNELADGVALVEAEKVSGNYYYSDELTCFTTALISLEKNNFEVNDLDDLKNRRITAFQDAKIIFQEVGELAKINPEYRELRGSQEGQVAQLFCGRADFILIDTTIFNYWCRETEITETDAPVYFHDLSIFPTIIVDSPTKAVFKNKKLCDEFNLGLRQLKNSGQYEEIIQSYLSE